MNDEYRMRSVLDANKGVTNVLESSTIRADLAAVYDKIYQTLKGHYGPYSKFAVLIEPNDYFADPVFTKDGINIVRAIEFISPMEEEVKKMVAYIGTRMESAVGEGTTSSMMFTCAVLKHMTELLYTDKYTHFTFQELRRAYDSIVDYIKKFVETHCVTWESLMKRDHISRYEAVYKIIYSQAYSSSHGDVELSKAVAEIFAGTPPESWKCMTFQRRTYESENRFDVESSEGQFELKCDPIVKSIYNKDMGTWLEYENAILCEVNDSMRFESPAYNTFMNVFQRGIVSEDEPVDSSTVRNKPIILISHNRIDGNTYDELIRMVRASHDTAIPFAIFTYDSPHPTCNELTVLEAICGQNPAESKGNLLVRDNVYAKYKGDKLVLNGLYEGTVAEDGSYSSEHPYLGNPKYDYFEHLLELFDNMQSGYDRLKMSPKEKQDQAMYRKLYNKMRFTNQKVLVIGGNAYDNLAMFDIVDDVITACSIAIREGVVPSNNRMIWHAINANRLHNVAYSNERTCHIYHAFEDAIIMSLEEMADNAIEMLPYGISDTTSSAVIDTQYWMNHCIDMIDFDASQKYPSIDNMFAGDDLMSHLIVQPANADISLVNRFGELALKFVLAERIIIKGGAFLGGKKQ